MEGSHLRNRGFTIPRLIMVKVLLLRRWDVTKFRGVFSFLVSPLPTPAQLHDFSSSLAVLTERKVRPQLPVFIV